MGGRDSVFSSCRLCLSLRMEWTAFRKSFLLSGELGDDDTHTHTHTHTSLASVRPSA